MEYEKIPKHVAIIMDGNGRWAKNRGLPRIFGHREGAKSVEEIVEEARKLGIEYLTLYAFSTENWKRPKKEIDFLFSLLVRYLNKEEKNLIKNNIRLKIIGNISSIPEKVREKLKKVLKNTSRCNKMTLILALNYGAREEILRGIKKVLRDFSSGKIKEKNLNEDRFRYYLDLKEIPDPDLLIRTSGEQRISNFLLWYISYTELYMTKVLWPEFRKEEFRKAIRDYSRRERRFGGI